MKKIMVTGKTIEDAISAGLEQLGLSRERVHIDIVEHPVKGLFGLIGAKEAKVELTPVHDPIDAAITFLEEVLHNMSLDATVERVRKDELETLVISGKELGIIIGRRGQTLDALQYLVNIVANRSSEGRVRLILDAENFRERRRQTLIQLAHRLADRVVKTNKEVVLEPMSPLERKVIHSELQDVPNVKTYSKGDEPNRRVIITRR